MRSAHGPNKQPAAHTADPTLAASGARPVPARRPSALAFQHQGTPHLSPSTNQKKRFQPNTKEKKKTARALPDSCIVRSLPLFDHAAATLTLHSAHLTLPSHTHPPLTWASKKVARIGVGSSRNGARKLRRKKN